MSVASMDPRRDFEVLAPGLARRVLRHQPATGRLRLAGNVFANPSNCFWRVMHFVGFTMLSACGLRTSASSSTIGLRYQGRGAAWTTRTAAEVTGAEFRGPRPTNWSALSKMTALAPRVVTSLSKRVPILEACCASLM